MSERLPDPVVSPDVYDEGYFRSCCGGHEEWGSSDGAGAGPMYEGSLRRARLRAGEVVVDIGTGRGELLAVAVEMGASRAVGVEYAAAAVTMAEQTLEAHGVTDRAEVLLADARSIPLDDGIADLVTMLDVVEHLAPDELARSLREAHRILRPGGRILIHTFPTKTIYRVYSVQRALVPGRRRRWPADPRHPLEKLMHVNEQTVGSLRRAIAAAGFRPARAMTGEWVYTDHIPDKRAHRIYHRLARHRAVAPFVVSNLWGEGVKQ
jgi:ubiquinone/menaquinone biosynthesis C-methylase UbiE